MITCRELIEFLDAYVANELAAARREEFDRHLAVCASCIAYLHTYRDTIHLTHSVDEPSDVPSEVVAAILAALRRTE